MLQPLFRLFRRNEILCHELNYLFWECTTRCNLHCRHCGSDCFVDSRNKDMPAEDFFAALDTIPAEARVKGFTVVLTGGEPLLRPDIEEIGRGIRRRGFGWSMVTNGFLYNEDMHARLMRAGLGAVTVSLDGTQESHDWMRGRQGSYSRALQAVRIISAESRLASDVVTCVNRRNIAELQQIYDTLCAAGARAWRIFTIIPIGRAASDPDMLIDPSDYRVLMDFISAKRREGGPLKVSFSCEGWLGPYEKKVRDVPFFCRAGINIASVLVDGRISGCPNIDRDAFSQGSIYSDNLWEVWQKGFRPFRDRSWTRCGSCVNCKEWRDCQGGGMHNWHGDLSAPLDCHYSKLTR